MRTSASVGCLMAESGTFSTRTSPAPYISVARMMVSPFTLVVTAPWSARAVGEDVLEDGQRGEDGRPA